MTHFDPDRHGPELSAYLDGELDPRKAAEVERLLADSTDARVYLDELRTVAENLRTLPRLSAPDALRAALRSRTDSTASDRPGARSSWIIALRTGAIAAALGVLWIAGQSLVNPVNSPHSAAIPRSEPRMAAREKSERAGTLLEDEPIVVWRDGADQDILADRGPPATVPPPTAAPIDIAARTRPFGDPAAPGDPGPDNGLARAPVVGGFAGGDAARDAVFAESEELPAGEVEVVINARTPAEFTEVNRLLLALQTPKNETRTAYVARIAEPDGGELHQLALPRAELGVLVSQLENLAPQNVRVQQLDAAPAAATPMIADETAQSAAGRLAAKPAGGAADSRAESQQEAGRQPPAERRDRTRPPQRPAGERPIGEALSGGGRAGAAPPVEDDAAIRKQQADRPASNAARGGRIIYRAPIQQQNAQQRGARAQSAASRPDADESLVVNVLVAPPAPQQTQPAQSQPASRPLP